METPRLHLPQPGSPKLTTLAYATVAVVWLQLIFGAAFRHNGMKVMWHLAWFVVVLTMMMWLILRVLRGYREVPVLRTAVYWLMGLLTLQILLGFGAFVTRVILNADAARPMTQPGDLDGGARRSRSTGACEYIGTGHPGTTACHRRRGSGS